MGDYNNDKQNYLQRSFLLNYLEYTEKTESPENYHLWVALSLIGAATERKIFLDNYYFKIYANLYVVLVGRSAITRKSGAMSIGMDIYKEAVEPDLEDPDATNILEGKITGADLITFLDAKASQRKSGIIYVQADELGNIFSSDNIKSGLVDMFTEFYMCKDRHQYRTKNKGKFYLENLFVNFLSGTTPFQIQEEMKYYIKKGFIGRCVFVYEDSIKEPFALPYMEVSKNEEKYQMLKSILVQQLRIINQREGEVVLDKEAESYYKEYYDQMHSKIEDDYSIASESGFLGRKGALIIQVAMLFTLAKEPLANGKIVIDKDTILACIDLVENAQKSLEKVFVQISDSELLNLQPDVEKYIEKNRKLSRTDLCRRFYRKMTMDQLSLIIESLEAARIIVRKRDVRTEYYYYVPTQFREIEDAEEMSDQTIEYFKTGGRDA